MWDASVPPGQHPVRLQRAKFKYRNTHYKYSENIQLFCIGLKINFLWIQPRCQISKMLYGKSIPYNYLRTKPSSQIITNSNQPSRRVTQVRNRDKINHLPFMIFIWLPSEDIHLFNKCSFCSIKSLYIQKPQFCLRVFFSNPQAQTQSKQAEEKIQIVSVKFRETCQTMFISNPQVVFSLNDL